MKSYLLSMLALISIGATAQEYRGEQSIQLSLGRAMHGSGDLRGMIFDGTHNYSFNKRMSLATSIAGTIHWGADYYTGSNFFNFRPADRSLTFTVAGFQVSPVINYHLINAEKHMLKAGVGALARFQSSSYPMGWANVDNPVNYAEPFYVLYNRGKKPNTVTAGYTFGFQYLYKFARTELGVKAMFQNDTEGDAITYISLIIGRRFRKLI